LSLHVDLVKRFEGLRLTSYQDDAGIWTVGYGHTGPEVGPGMAITNDEALDLLDRDLDWATAVVDNSIKAKMTEGQRAALISLAFNIGAGEFRKSTALRRLNAGDYFGAAEAITWWNKITKDGKKVVSRGLVNRREAERQMFLAGVQKDDSVVGGPVSGGEHKPIIKSKTVTTAVLGGLLPAVLEKVGMIKSSVPEVFNSIDVVWVMAAAVAIIIAIRIYEMKKGDR
jgi:lysozyme